MLDKSLGIFIEKSTRQSAWNMAEMHLHKSHELFFLISGKRRYFIEHSIYDVAPGNLVVIPRMQLHRTITPGQGGYERYVCNFLELRLGPFIDTVGREVFDRFLQGGCLQLPPTVVHQVHRDFEQLGYELENRSAYTDAAALHLLQDILLCAMRYGKEKAPVSGESADRVQEAARYINEHYASELTLADAAKLACMEETYFSKRFKALTGVGFHRYLTRTRLRAAEQLLERTELSMSEIAEYCGFSGSNYFGDVFRRWYGISPSDYRRKARNDG